MGDRCYPDGWAHTLKHGYYIFIIYDILEDRTRSLFSLSLDNGSSRQTSGGPFFSSYTLYTLYEGCVCILMFFLSISSGLLRAVAVVSYIYMLTFDYMDAPSK